MDVLDFQTCHQANSPGDVMICPSPNIASVGGLMASAKKPITASVSFMLEGWVETPVPIGPDMLYYPDPSFNQFSPGTTISEGSKLTLQVSSVQ